MNDIRTNLAGGEGEGEGPNHQNNALDHLFEQSTTVLDLDQQEACFQVIMRTYLNIGSSSCTSTSCPLT